MAANLLVLGVAFGLLFADRTLPRYVDESDNLLGGQLVARGYRLHVDFFSQHMPFPYLMTALATLLGARDLVAYRIVFAALLTGVLAGVVVYFRRRLSSVFVYALVLTIGIGHPLYSGYLLLADGLFAMALLVVVLLMLTEDGCFGLGQQLAISACVFVAVQSTLISIYPLALLGGYHVLRAWVVRRAPTLSRSWSTEMRFAALIALPHLVLVLVMLGQGTLGPLWDQAFVFNQQYYSRYDIGGDPLGILRNSLADFGGLVAAYLRPSGVREVETVLLVSNVVAGLVVWRRRSGLLGGVYVGVVVLSRMRGAGYHGAPYFVLSFVSIALVLAQAWGLGAAWVRTRADGAGWLGPGVAGRAALAGALAVYVAWVGVWYHDLGGFYVRLPRGQGLSSPYAPIVSALTDPNDRLWAAPFEPDVYVETGRLPASAYWYYHPWLADSPQITAGVLRDLQAVRPPVVIFRADKQIPWSFPLPTPADFGREVYAFVQRDYVALDPGTDVLRDVYLRRDVADVLRARFVSASSEPPTWLGEPGEPRAR